MSEKQNKILKSKVAWKNAPLIEAQFFGRHVSHEDLRSLYSPDTKVLMLKQIHSNKIVVIDSVQPGAKVAPPADLLPPADAMVTTLPNVALTIHTADCLPILAFDKEVIGACHGGWRGIESGILENWVDEMAAQGAKKNNLQLSIGPAIGVCHFEVGKDVAEKLCRVKGVELPAPWLKKVRVRHSDPQKYFINLRQLAVFRLINAGVFEKNISHVDRCTYCEPKKYFSFRRDAEKNKRLESVIVRRL